MTTISRRIWRAKAGGRGLEANEGRPPGLSLVLLMIRLRVQAKLRVKFSAEADRDLGVPPLADAKLQNFS